MLDQFCDRRPCDPGRPGARPGAAPSPAARPRPIDGDLGPDELRPSAAHRATDNAAVQPHAENAPPPRGNGLGGGQPWRRRRALRRAGAIEHIPDAAGMTPKVLVVRRPRTGNVCARSRDRRGRFARIVEQMFKSHRRDSDERGRSKEAQAASVGVTPGSATITVRPLRASRRAAVKPAGPPADHETVGAQHVQGRISPGR